MVDHPPSGVFSPAAHSCNDECMLSSDDEEHKRETHPLRQNPPSIREEDRHDVLLAPSRALTSDHSTGYSPRPPSPIEDFPSIPTRNGHQRSWTSTFKLPPLVAQTASRASLHSPTKTLGNWISSQSVQQEGAPPTSPNKQRANILSDWFVGTSAPVQLGLPSRPRRDSLSPTRSPDDYLSSDGMGEGYTARPRRTRRSSTATSSPGGAGFTNKLWGLTRTLTAASTASTRPSATPDLSDELLSLDISHALLPHGVPDILAPSSFHDLLTASTELLARYQTAYRAKSSALSEAQLERGAQHEELEEAETRARHLKMQLDGMAEKAKQQEEAMRALGLELLAERRRREDEDAARRLSVQAVADRGVASAALKDHSHHILHHTEQHNRRGKAASSSAGSSAGSLCDSGFESDADSAMDAGSVGGVSFTSGPTLAGEEDFFADAGSVRRRPLVQRRLSTYDKVLRTVAGEPASAWAVMEGYKEENRMLRDRIHELEGAVDSALDLVGGLGI